ncbi:hypothetical protein [Lacibacter sp. H407]|uniref:hypothetical protein n=1 Tax=Lacibacter sp. H407 TaxID=3133423 RepID=UPI0030C5D519
MAITDFLTNPVTIAELLALVGACVFLLSEKAGYWRLFILFCVVLLLAELTGFYMRTVMVKSNHAVYNLLMPVQVAFFLFLFYRFHQSKKLKKMIVAAAVLFLLFYFTESIVHAFAAYNKYSRQYLSLVIVLFSCTFYFTLLQNDEVKNPLSHPAFWIVTGLFFYYFGSIVMFAFYEQVSKIKLAGNLSFYTLVIGYLSFILYGSWIIGFIWKKKQLRSS